MTDWRPGRATAVGLQLQNLEAKRWGIYLIAQDVIEGCQISLRRHYASAMAVPSSPADVTPTNYKTIQELAAVDVRSRANLL